MAMATSNPARRRATIGAIVAAVLGLATVTLVLVAGSSGARGGAGARTAATPRPSSAFAWLHAQAAAAGWQRATTVGREATLFYPPTWISIPGDAGTVTRALRDRSGLYVGYLNATPRQGAEQLRGWASFRTDHNREEGDRQVRQVAADDDLAFRRARGSCVLDDYLSRVGSHPYREIACLVQGPNHTGVFIGAALRRDWPVLSRTLERAADAFVQG